MKSSAINLDCSADDLTDLLLVEEIPRQQILDRSGQFEKSGENLNICNDHYSALITNFQIHKTCLAENHDETKSRRLEGNESTNAKVVKKELSQHLLNSNGFLLPVGSHICAKCRHELSVSNPLPKKRKLVSDINILPQKKQLEPEITVCSTGDTMVTRQKSRLQIRKGPL